MHPELYEEWVENMNKYAVEMFVPTKESRDIVGMKCYTMVKKTTLMPNSVLTMCQNDVVVNGINVFRCFI